jgi:hypothetical protein
MFRKKSLKISKLLKQKFIMNKKKIENRIMKTKKKDQLINKPRINRSINRNRNRIFSKNLNQLSSIISSLKIPPFSCKLKNTQSE